MNKQKKNQALAATLALTLLVGGTYAWQSFSQTIINETAGFDADQGSRLHNDFNGSNADVYVENFASESGSTLYTRIRLHEYMEIGTGAGTGAATIVRGDEPVSGADPVFAEKDTWDIYLDQGNDREEEDIRSYLGLNYGEMGNANAGATVYMPTFNKNFDDKTADINGSLLGLGGSEYDDYATYSIGESITDVATYSKGSLAAEGQTPNAEGVVELTETHTAQSTLQGYVTTMEQWNTDGQQTGDFWVFDTDGWAYWANGLAPQTATSLLVDSISKVRTPDADYYYGLHVVNQTATVDGWVDALTTEVQDTVSLDALNLMNMTWDIEAVKFEIGEVEIQELESTKLSTGDKVELSVSIATDESDDRAKSLLWFIEALEPENISRSSNLKQSEINKTLSQEGVFEPVNGMEGSTYRITARAKYDARQEDTIDVIVYNSKAPTIIGNLTVGQVEAFVGAGTTVTWGGIDFYVMETQTYAGAEVAKLVVKNGVADSSFGSNNTYATSNIRTHALDWYNNTLLKSSGVNESDIFAEGTTFRALGTPVITEDDKAFIMSTGDAGTLPMSVRYEMRDTWLRTAYSTAGAYAIETSRTDSTIASMYSCGLGSSFAVRPVVWIYL